MRSADVVSAHQPEPYGDIIITPGRQLYTPVAATLE
jgi:hypothetical protein